jgi:hypothetical protein
MPSRVLADQPLSWRFPKEDQALFDEMLSRIDSGRWSYFLWALQTEELPVHGEWRAKATANGWRAEWVTGKVEERR